MRTFLLAAFIPFAVASISLGGHQEPTEHVLDLGTMKSEAGFLVAPSAGNVPMEYTFFGFPVTITGHAPRPTLVSPFTFSATILSFDAEGYRHFAPLIYELRLTNTGSAAINFPWSPDASMFDAREPGICNVKISLAGRSSTGERIEFAMAILYGAPAIPKSLETIQPRDSIRMRIKSDWMAYFDGTVDLGVIVTASMAGENWPEISSTNTITIASRK